MSRFKKFLNKLGGASTLSRAQQPQETTEVVFPYRQGRSEIDHMCFEVCSGCQLDCKMCAHGQMRKDYKNYQLALEELDRFLSLTKQSKYCIKSLLVHGGGEPLLWKHFNEGIKMIRDSGVVDEIFVTTNGLLIESVRDETWERIDRMRVNIYSPDTRSPALDQFIKRYGKKVKRSGSKAGKFEKKLVAKEGGRRENFMPLPMEKNKGAIPCRCECSGPMFIKDKIFYYCGPPVFDAAKLREESFWEYKQIYTDLKLNYLDDFDARLEGNIELCRACWSNPTARP